MRRASLLLGLGLVPVCFDMRMANPLALKLSVWCLAAALALLSGNPLSRPRACGWAWPSLWLWTGWLVLSGLVHHSWNGSLWALTVVCACLWRPPTARDGLPFVLGAWFVTAAYSWIQRLGWDPFPWDRPELSRLKTIAGLGNPNYLAMFLAGLLPLVWWWAYRRGWWACVLVALGLATLVMTTTRGALLALLIVTTLATLGSAKRLGWRFWLVTWATLVSMFVAGLSAPRELASSLTDQRTGVGLQEYSVASRLLLWQVALQAGREHPVLGVGPGQFGGYYLQHRPLEYEAARSLQRLPEDPHNEPVHVLSETGLVGLMLWSLWLGCTAYGLALRDPVGLASLCVFLLNGLTNSYPLAVWPVLIWLTARAEAPESPPRSPPSGWRWWVTPLVLVLVLLAGGTWYAQRSFWWDDEFQIRGSASRTLQELDQLTHQRLLILRNVQPVCPPYYRAELARRMSLVELTLAQVQSRQGSTASGEAAVAWARTRTELDPGNAYSFEGLALVYEGLGRWEEAETAWRQAHRLDPLNPAMLFFWGGALARVGKSEQALQRLQESLEINSNYAQVYQLRAQIMIEQGQTWEGYWDWVRGCQHR